MADGMEPKLTKGASPAAAFKVEITGMEPLTQDKPGALSRFTVETHLDKIGMAQITLNFSGDLKPGDLTIGAEVKISVGGSADNAFTGNITGFRHSWKNNNEFVTVEAMDPLVKLASSRETKQWGGETTDAIKDSDAVSEVLSAGGCSAGNVEATTGTRPYILQRNESNLAFIKRLAARNGYLVFASEGKVNFQKPQFSGASADVTLEDITSLDYGRADTEIPSEVEVTGWDYIAKQRVVGTSSSVTPIGGAAATNTTFKNAQHISDVFVDSEASATAMAEAEMNRLARTFIRGSCTTRGNGKVKIGSKVKFAGSFKTFNPEGLVVGVRHTVQTGSVFETTFWFVSNSEPT